ncbi:hypothetical protein ATANTOWER_022498, partial [Ataeniobius toweri]|nr:hypothetical protein [Ataeniobius toweri]
MSLRSDLTGEKNVCMVEWSFAACLHLSATVLIQLEQLVARLSSFSVENKGEVLMVQHHHVLSHLS